ncbi:MAG: ubiquinol-cytochrome c reductase iron-sulfur subunit [Thermomicrobiales bacterium]
MIIVARTLGGFVLEWLVVRLLELVARLVAMHPREARRVTRRTFVRNATLGAVVLMLAQLGAGFARFFWPNQTGAFGGEIRVQGAQVPEVNGTPFKKTEGKFYVVHTEDGLLALYWKCPHLGCTVPWNEGRGQFVCPCHGSVYTYDGVRIAGPAPRPMDLMAVSIAQTGDIIVDTGAITQRGDYDPGQAVKYVT